ncbi:MAG: pyridoxal phosphate-dependent aminotransferase [Propionibacteriaceae bacterium]|nr:pyridoxal phosphate-dependent aminotransferase [Propionibacteriaceae bacterium]
MTYDFDALIERAGSNSLKWDVRDGELPMWVADMDFLVAPVIRQTVLEKASSGIFGYGIVPPGFAQAVHAWWEGRYGFGIESEWVQFCHGIVPAVSSLIRTLAEPGEGVVIQSPVYNCFYYSIEKSARTALINNLPYRNGQYGIDWDDLEAKLSDPRARMFLLCNPQNPTGQIWSPEELARMGEMAAAHQVTVISDEIHCDITEPGLAYTPFASVNQTCANTSITLVSPTKSFNIPGLQTSVAIVPDPALRKLTAASLSRDELTGPNSFAVEALIAAYTQGGDWLDAMRDYVWQNKALLSDFVGKHMPELHVIPGESTYLSWVDCSGLTEDATAFCTFLRQQTGLYVNPGELYGDNAKAFFRINLACPSSRVEDALERLSRGVAEWKARD